MKKPAFPQTPEGVTDWEKVFEDSDDGLITMLRNAQSADGLRSCMMVIIQQLFTRKGDELEVAQLTRQLDGLLEQSGGALPTDEAISMLRQIKEQRQAKAKAYLADKGKKKRKKNRRTASGSATTKNIIYLVFKDPKYFVGLCLALLAALGAVVAILVTGGVGGNTPKVEEEFAFGHSGQQGRFKGAESNAVEQLIPKAKPKAADTALPEFTEESRRKSVAIVLRHVNLPRSFAKLNRGPSNVLPFIVLKSKDEMSAVCRQLPFILNKLNVELSKAYKDINAFDEQILNQVGYRVGVALNSKLEERPVMRFHLAIPTNARDGAPGSCSLAPDTLGKYLR